MDDDDDDDDDESIYDPHFYHICSLKTWFSGGECHNDFQRICCIPRREPVFVTARSRYSRSLDWSFGVYISNLELARKVCV